MMVCISSHIRGDKIMTKSNVKLPKTLDVKLTDAMIEKDIVAVKSKVKTVNNAIQSVLTKVMLRWHQSGDVATACRFMNTLVLELDGTAVRNNAIKSWIQAYCGFNWVKGDDGKSLFTYNKKRSKVSYDEVVTAHQNMWSTFTKEPEYKGMNLDDVIAKLIIQVEKKLEKPNELDNINLETYKALKNTQYAK
jgi:hypothetical protein